MAKKNNNQKNSGPRPCIAICVKINEAVLTTFEALSSHCKVEGLTIKPLAEELAERISKRHLEVIFIKQTGAAYRCTILRETEAKFTFKIKERICCL